MYVGLRVHVSDLVGFYVIECLCAIKCVYVNEHVSPCM